MIEKRSYFIIKRCRKHEKAGSVVGNLPYQSFGIKKAAPCRRDKRQYLRLPCRNRLSAGFLRRKRRSAGFLRRSRCLTVTRGKSAAPVLSATAAPQVSSREITVLLNADAAAASGDKEVVPAADMLLSGAETVSAAADGDFLPVRFAYRSYPAWQAFFINLIKPVKRKFYSVFRQPIRQRWPACSPTILPAANVTSRMLTSGPTKNGR